jgi:hypothetical protein
MEDKCVAQGEMRNIYRILVGKAEGTRSLGIHMRKRDNNIKMQQGMRFWIKFIWLMISLRDRLS